MNLVKNNTAVTNQHGPAQILHSQLVQAFKTINGYTSTRYAAIYAKELYLQLGYHSMEEYLEKEFSFAPGTIKRTVSFCKNIADFMTDEIIGKMLHEQVGTNNVIKYFPVDQYKAYYITLMGKDCLKQLVDTGEAKYFGKKITMDEINQMPREDFVAFVQRKTKRGKRGSYRTAKTEQWQNDSETMSVLGADKDFELLEQAQREFYCVSQIKIAFEYIAHFLGKPETPKILKARFPQEVNDAYYELLEKEINRIQNGNK